jgi:hypothetical protein
MKDLNVAEYEIRTTNLEEVFAQIGSSEKTEAEDAPTSVPPRALCLEISQ